jgi:ADP-L-glycero-D-manno-heptose 6-epimerase
MGLIIVTGGAGFIGSNVIRALNAAGSNDIVVVEDFSKGDKRAQLEGCVFQELMERKEFLQRISSRGIGNVDAVFHQGACTDTMEHDARLMMELNLDTSQALLEWVLKRDIPMVYASSAAVYGASTTFTEVPANEAPLNVYGESKLKFDHLVRRAMAEAKATLVGLRYFNVYGPRETWKGRMASVVYQMYGQLRETGTVRLFVGTGGYGDGEQRRDFVHVDDVVAVNMFFARGLARQGIVNCGTGRSRSFNDVARIAAHGSGRIEYVPLPEGLAERYQSFTEADLTGLRHLGYEAPFLDVDEGVRRYYRSLSRT